LQKISHARKKKKNLGRGVKQQLNYQEKVKGEKRGETVGKPAGPITSQGTPKSEERNHKSCLSKEKCNEGKRMRKGHLGGLSKSKKKRPREWEPKTISTKEGKDSSKDPGHVEKEQRRNGGTGQELITERGSRENRKKNGTPRLTRIGNKRGRRESDLTSLIGHTKQKPKRKRPGLGFEIKGVKEGNAAPENW